MGYLKTSDEERASSGVISIILLLIIISAFTFVIGAYIFEFANMGNDVPQAEFSSSYDGFELIITHQGGNNIQTDNIRVLVEGEERDTSYSSNPLISGSRIYVSPVTSGSEVTVVYIDESRSDSQIIYRVRID